MIRIGRSNALGFGLLEVVIALVVIITLAVVTIPLVTKFGWGLIDAKKVTTSIERLHEAANSYYYNQILKEKEPWSSLTIKHLIDAGYLNEDDIYEYNQRNIAKPPYTYEVQIKSGNEQHRYIEIKIESSRDLHALNPDEVKLACSGINPKCGIRDYYWRYPVSLDTYSNLTKHRVARSAVFVRHAVDTYRSP